MALTSLSLAHEDIVAIKAGLAGRWTSAPS
jgi:hypothetical protein